MSTIFNDDFHTAGVLPDGWMIEKHADRFHDLVEIRAGAMRILFPGNLHVPLIKPIRDGTLLLTVRSDIYSKSCAVRIFFRYDPQLRAGYCMRHTWGADGVSTAFGVYRGGEFTTLNQSTFDMPGLMPPPSDDHSLRLEFSAHEFLLYHQTECVARFADPQKTFDCPGLLALDRGAADRFYVFDIKNAQILSDEPAPFKELWPERIFTLPSALNGITDPWHLKISARRSSCCVKIDAEIFGGPANRAPAVDDSRDLRGNSRLTRPYIRVEPGMGHDPQKRYLHSGSLGLKEHWEPRSSGDLPCDSEGPIRRELLMKTIPDDAWMALGYEYYEAEDRLALAGGPSEMLICPKTGEVIHDGPALDPGALVLEIKSPPDKKIASMIPANEIRREQALAFARDNHFFFESEPVVFTVQARHRQTELCDKDLSLKVTLEDAFQTSLDERRNIELSAQLPVAVSVDRSPHPTVAVEDINSRLYEHMGVTTLTSDPLNFADLKVGVYHIHVELRRGSQALLEARRAFEVMSDDPAFLPPPLVSGLPDLIPQIPDYATATGAFDPWMGRGVDAAHYLGNCSHHILPARQNRIWDVVHLYRRRWVVELHRRMTPDPTPESNADVVKHADRVYWNQRHDLWHGGYDKVVLAALMQFIRQTLPATSLEPGRPGADLKSEISNLKSCLDADVIEKTGKLTVEMYRELLTRHWKAWVEFFNQWMLDEHVPAMHARLRAVNPQAEWVTYGIYPPYASTYKGAYFARYTGRDLRNGFERFYDGPMLLEDYSYMCGYPLQRAVFMLAAMKLEAPKLKQYPEVYGVNGCADDLKPVYGMPPYAHSHAPPAFFRKTVFEYAFAAAWFDTDGFHYWNDNGFQAMAWTAEHYNTVVRAWGLVKKHQPAKPLRTTAFVVSRDACLAHPDIFTETRVNPDFEDRLCFHDVINTAEENTAFAYEEARKDGQQAGFLLDMADIGTLDPADAHTLVLPPLSSVDADCQAAIRRLHERGVALVGFEEAAGLADLFGVRRRTEPVGLDAVCAARNIPAGIDVALPKEPEKCETSHCLAHYDAADAVGLIDGLDAKGRKIVSALVCRQTSWGRTVFFNIPPTMVKRLGLKSLVSYGKESRSALMNHAMALVLRWAGRPTVETTAGKIIAFYDQRGQINVIIMEDAHPAPAVSIRPVVTIRYPGLEPQNVTCDCEWHLVETHPEYLRIGLELLPHASAHIALVCQEPPARNLSHKMPTNRTNGCLTFYGR